MQGIRIQLTSERENILHRVQISVNNRVKYVSDREQFNESDKWSDACDDKGDCEDYAEAKQQLLLQEGFPELCMARGTCWTETGQYHAVLLVNTHKGVYILDNRQHYVMPWTELEELGYHFDYRPQYIVNAADENVTEIIT